MFKKNCKKCGEKISHDLPFCPFCGNNVQRQKEDSDYGLLGTNDNLELPETGFGLPLGLNGLNGIFNSLLKEVNKQFKELDKQMADDIKKPEMPKSSISISISTLNGKNPEIKISGLGPQFEKMNAPKVQEKKILPTKITSEQVQKLSSLPRKEAETKVRRLSNRLIYEIATPGVKTLNEVIINKLENSIEIKAFSKDTVYVKLIPLRFPILDYSLKEEKLILELKPEN